MSPQCVNCYRKATIDRAALQALVAKAGAA